MKAVEWLSWDVSARQIFFLERVLFPTDILTFMAPNDSRVEIWGNELYGPKLEERIRISADNEDSTLVA